MTAFALTSYPRRRLAENAVREVVTAQLATPQLLVRKLDVTPARAEDLLRLLAEVGVVRLSVHWSAQVLFKPDQVDAAIACLPAQKSRQGLDDQLNQMQADGRIGDDDAEEVRRFADFLGDMADAGIRPSREARDRAAAKKARDIYLKHYPEHAPKESSR